MLLLQGWILRRRRQSGRSNPGRGHLMKTDEDFAVEGSFLDTSMPGVPAVHERLCKAKGGAITDLPPSVLRSPVLWWCFKIRRPMAAGHAARSSSATLATVKATLRGAAWLCFASLVQGGVGAAGAPNHHVSVDSAVYPWSSLAKIFNSVGGACTGAVIGRDRVLTAAHCVYAFRTRRFLPPDALHILLGYDRGQYSTHARVVRYRLGPGYDPEAERKTAASDWVVLDLAEPLPANVRPLYLDTAGPVTGKAVMLAGFARDRAFVMTADEECRVTGRVDPGRLIAHDCAVQPGDSGAPVIGRSDAGADATIVGVTVGIWHTATGAIGVAAPVSPDMSDPPH